MKGGGQGGRDEGGGIRSGGCDFVERYLWLSLAAVVPLALRTMKHHSILSLGSLFMCSYTKDVLFITAHNSFSK